MLKTYNFQNLVSKTRKIRGIKTNNYKDTGKYPVIDQGNQLIAGYSDDEKTLYKDTLPVVVFGDHTLAVKFVDFPFCVGADGTQILKPNEKIIIGKFLYYAILNLNIHSLGYSRHFKILKVATFRVPEIEIQKRIVKILDQSDALRQKRKQAIGVLDEYLSSVFLDTIKIGKIERIRFLDLFNITTGKLNANAAEKDGLYPFYTCSREDNLRINTYAFDYEALILSGNNANAEYSVKHYSGKFNAYQRTYILTLKKDHSYLYFKRALESKLKLLQESSIGSNTKYLTLGIFKRIDFEVPNNDLQKKYENIAKKTEVLKQTMLTQSKELEIQFQALMQKAFNGEL